MRESKVRVPVAAGWVLCGWALVLAAGCGSRLDDRTAPRVAYAPPLNRQLFAADVTPESSGRVIRDVELETDGTSAPMANSSGTRWERTAIVPPCREIVPYRFIVYSGDAEKPDEEPHIETFPEIGSFTRLITDQPPDCDKIPTERSLAFRVTTTEDAVDAVPGDGFCSTTKDPNAPGSQCTLRAAVMEANHKQGLDVIILRSDRYRLTLKGAETDDTPDETVGDLDITDSVSIESEAARNGCATSIASVLNPDDHFSDRGGTSAPIAHIDGGGIDRVFDIYTASAPRQTEVYLSCLHVFGGRVDADTLGPRRYGGGIMNRGVLVMDRLALRANTMTGASAGAGLSNSGEVVARQTALLSNVGDLDGALFGGTSGGAVYNASGAKLTFDRSVAALNEAARGPGIFNDFSGTLTVVNSTVTDNTGNWGNAGTLAAAIFSRGTETNIAWSTLQAFRSALTSIYETNLLNSLVMAQSDVTTTCPLLFDGSTTIAVRATGEGCMTRTWRGRANNVVQSFLHGVGTSLEMRGGFTPVLSIRRAGAGESPADFPPDTALTLSSCPATDQRGRPRPVADTSTCDPGAMELQAGE